MEVQWNKCVGDIWCQLNNVDLKHSNFTHMEGVYIIWHDGDEPTTVRVGQGVIRDRIAAHRKDPDVQAYARWTLYVTWAYVAQVHRDGVEAFLAEVLNPLIGERFPDRKPIPVNLPW